MASARVSTFLLLRLMNRSVKSTPPIKIPRGGMMMSFTTEDTILPNAPPMITPTAMSTTLPRRANALNSVKNFPMSCCFLSYAFFFRLLMIDMQEPNRISPMPTIMLTVMGSSITSQAMKAVRIGLM